MPDVTAVPRCWRYEYQYRLMSLETLRLRQSQRLEQGAKTARCLITCPYGRLNGLSGRAEAALVLFSMCRGTSLRHELTIRIPAGCLKRAALTWTRCQDRTCGPGGNRRQLAAGFFSILAEKKSSYAAHRGWRRRSGEFVSGAC